jgi:hypothetical protein
MVLLLNLDSVYTINDPDVIADSIQGETLIINLINGVYYSSEGVGDEIWRHLQSGRSVGEVVEAISARYAGDGGTIREDVLGFISELRSDDLVVEIAPPATRAVAPNEGDGKPPVYVKPVLQRYSDYQELLLLDPIHEVLESAGWPVAKPDTKSQPGVE